MEELPTRVVVVRATAQLVLILKLTLVQTLALVCPARPALFRLPHVCAPLAAAAPPPAAAVAAAAAAAA